MLISNLIQDLQKIVGENNVLSAYEDLIPFIKDWRGIYLGATAAVVRPANTQEVAAVIHYCSQRGIAIVPQGGNTGMCGAAIPNPNGEEIVLSLARMNKIRSIDALNNTLTVDAGCVLAAIQGTAAEVDRLFPLSLGAEGSCQIGGNLSTNAGGVNVLRYGNTRDLVLGLEVVLPDGRIWDGLRSLRKDNTGYDLKQLFIGAEGTLGIITGATLKLFPRPIANATAWMAVPSPESALRLLALIRQHCGERISAFEIISRHSLELVWRHIPNTRDPLDTPHEWQVLTELADSGDLTSLRADLERALESAINEGLVVDAIVAENRIQAQSLWHMRESIPEGARQEPVMVYRHDIAVAVSRIPEFIAEAGAALEARFPGVRLICFGHLGDGNLHYNAYIPERLRNDPKSRNADDVTQTVYDIVRQYGGSFSAEHGIGQSKVNELVRYKSSVEMDLMRTIKSALDPKGLFNPGKIL
jgi:FAD/FMN-containing dehydrogenase